MSALRSKLTRTIFHPCLILMPSCQDIRGIHQLFNNLRTLLVTVSVFEYFCPKLSKSVQYDLWLFQFFLAFFNSLYQDLSGFVSHISLELHIYPQEVQEHRLFCSFSWKIRFLLLAHVRKKVKNFTGAHICTQTQLVMNNLRPTNMPIIKNQVQLGAFKV